MFAFLFAYQFQIFPPPIGLSTFGLEEITGFALLDALLTADFSALWQVFTYYLLPALTLAFVLAGPIIKQVRQNATRVHDSTFIHYARGWGSPVGRSSRTRYGTRWHR